MNNKKFRERTHEDSYASYLADPQFDSEHFDSFDKEETARDLKQKTEISTIGECFDDCFDDDFPF